MDYSNQEIVYKLKIGNQLVFEQLFKKYYSMLCFEARGYIGVSHLAEEIVCDVFTKLWLNRESLQIKTSIREYLIKAVHNNCIDYYRHLKYQDRLKHGYSNSLGEITTLHDIGENPLDYIITQELEDSITEAIESLPDQYKKTFKLSRFSEMSYDEIAVEMGVSINTVKTNMKNALSKLRDKLGKFLTF